MGLTPLRRGFFLMSIDPNTYYVIVVTLAVAALLFGRV